MLFLQDQNDKTYPKMSPTNYAITKLVAQQGKRPNSLANGSRFQLLKQKRNEAIEGSNKGDWDDKESDALPASSKYKTEPFTVEVDVGGTSVTMLCPVKRSMVADPMVLLDSEMLAAVLSFVRPDVAEGTTTRAYKVSGKFSGKTKK